MALTNLAASLGRWFGRRAPPVSEPAAERLSPRVPLAKAPQLWVHPCRSLEDFQAFCRDFSPELEARHAEEIGLLPPGDDAFDLAGWCLACGAQRVFHVGRSAANGATEDGRALPNWREAFGCPACRLNSRQRAALHLLAQEIAPADDAVIYATEQITPLFARLAQAWPRSIGSEYLGSAHPPGAVVDGVRNEDLHRLSFADSSLDAVVSLDVFEHLPDPVLALGEVFRCLKPGGALLLSVPFDDERYETEVRARLTPQGETEHLLPPQHHEDPLDPSRGVLVWQVPGWELLDQMRVIGFGDPAALYYWSRTCAYLGNAQMAIAARKPGASGS